MNEVRPAETPRQFLLRITGKDRAWLKDYSWGDVMENGMMQEITRIVQDSDLPNALTSIVMREKSDRRAFHDRKAESTHN